MTNFEKYSEGIIKIMKDGDIPAKKGDKIVPCLKIPCKECDFHDDKNGCMFDRKWLFEDDGEPSLAISDLQAEKTANLKIQNGKLAEKVENLKSQNAKLARKLQNQKEEITRLLEAQKEKYEAGYQDGVEIMVATNKVIPILEDLLKSAISTCETLSVQGTKFREAQTRIEEQAEALKYAIKTLKHRGESNDSTV